MMNKYRIAAVLSVLLLIIGSLGACGPTAQVVKETVVVEKTVPAEVVKETVVVEVPVIQTPEPGAIGGTFVFARSADPSSLDPMNASEGEGIRTTEQMMEGLARVKPGTDELEPWLAERWEASPDAKIWTFYLRKGVQFHDGTPFNAEAVVFNFDRWRFKDNPYHIGEFENWLDFMGDFPGNVVDVKAMDEYTVQISLENPIGPFIAMLSSPNFALSSPTAIKADPENAFKNPVGTGPFKFVEWLPGDKIVMERFEGYWGPPPYLDKVVMRVIKDPTARFLELQAGTVDAIDNATPDDVLAAEEDPELTVLLREPYGVGHLTVMHTVKPFDDVRVRRAMAYAIDREGLLELYGGMATPANQYRPPLDWAYNPDLPPIEHDVVKAKELLAEAGYPDGFETDLWYMPVSRPYFPQPLEAAQKMAADLAEVGIKVNLKTEDWAAYLNDRPNFSMWMMGGWPPVPDASWLLGLMFGQLSPREGNYDNAKVRELIAEAQATVEQTERQKIYQEVAQILYDDMARIPVVFCRLGAVVTRANVHGYYPSLVQREFYQYVWLTK